MIQKPRVSKDLLDIPEIAEAFALAEESAYTPGELNYYENYWDQVRREKTLISGKFDQGKAEGKAEGRLEEKREMAKKLLKRGVSIDIIVEDTELTREEVEAITRL